MARHARGSPWARRKILLWVTTAVLLLLGVALGVHPGSPVAAPGAPASISAPGHPQPGASPHKPAQHPHRHSLRHYTVRPGDSLWSIAVTHYHNGMRWHQLYTIN